MLGMLPGHKRKMALALLLCAGEIGVLIAGPLLGARIINALASYQWENFRHTLILLGLLTLAQLFIGFSRQYMFVRIDESVGGNLRTTVVNAILEKPLPFYERHWVGDIVSRAINDTSLLKPFLTGILLQLIIDVLTLLVVVTILVQMSPTLALLTIATAPVTLLYGRQVQPRLEAASQKIREGVAGLNGHLQSWLSRPFALKIHSLEAEASQSFARRSQELASSGVRLGVLGASLGALNTVLLGIPTLLIFGYGGYITLTGQLSVGELFAFMTYASYFAAPIQRLIGTSVVALPTLYPVQNRVREFLEPEHTSLKESPGTGPPPESLTSLRATGIKFGFENKIDYSLTVAFFSARRGEVVGISGQNGSGKSTLTRILAGVYQPESGEVRLQAEDGTQIVCAERRGFFGFLPQEPALFDGTLSENVTLFDTKPNLQRLVEIQRELGMADWLNSLPQGWETPINAGLANTFSGGQTQKIGLARLLYRRRPILIMDEPSNGLDENMLLRFRHLLGQLKSKHIIIVIAHSPETLALCDRLYELRSIPGKGMNYECVAIAVDENLAGVESRLRTEEGVGA